MKCMVCKSRVEDRPEGLCLLCQDRIERSLGQKWAEAGVRERRDAIRDAQYNFLSVDRRHKALEIIRAWDVDFAIRFLKERGVDHTNLTAEFPVDEDGNLAEEVKLFRAVAKEGDKF